MLSTEEFRLQLIYGTLTQYRVFLQLEDLGTAVDGQPTRELRAAESKPDHCHLCELLVKQLVVQGRVYFEQTCLLTVSVNLDPKSMALNICSCYTWSENQKS